MKVLNSLATDILARRPAAFGCTRLRACPLAFRAAAPRAAGAPRLNVQRNATRDNSVDDDVDDCSTNVNAFCSIDETGARRLTQLSLGEKEQMFLEALSSFYFEGKPKLSDQEFDLLKEELLWNGSKVAVLSSDEIRFIEAQKAYRSGKPLLSDDEFDALRGRLRRNASLVTAQGPRCSLRSQAMYSDAEVAYGRMLALNVPATLAVLVGVFLLDDLTGFKLTGLLELPAPWGIILTWAVALPSIYLVVDKITSIAFKDALVLVAPCPNCGTTTTTYFGDILTVPGNRKQNDVQCRECKSNITFNAEKRQAVVTNLPSSGDGKDSKSGGPKKPSDRPVPAKA
ncbi:PGRL1 [Auxenochlorella protothecoides x Auxenochlorella symbiontica]|uniref:PGR5-like protein 1A, chloroplastic n=1 Tax=Auxenochlorella protothecoides TaxID=3075 RepID=A0A1D1ZT14_AUXPR